MGEVYRARDAKLGREVAIKVLPSEFSQDADRLARLEREARVLAALNHPNIAAIHGLEESRETRFLVLELVEGDTLADRLKRGAIPVEESLKLALQIAEALEAAHDKGVVHRDLKPANIKVTPEGRVKVLDFGLAKAFEGVTGDVNLSNSPTLSMQATQAGIILGTAAYMAPEQARGRSTDARADVWAFGCVLFEMLSGRKAFHGDEIADILAAVLAKAPAWDALPQRLHPRLRELLERSLEKQPRDRYHSVADIRSEIERVLADPAGLMAPESVAIAQAGLGSKLPWVAAIALATAVTGLGTWMLTGSGEEEPGLQARFAIETPPDGAVVTGYGWRVVTVSPDGERIAYASLGPGGTNGSHQIYTRRLDELNATVLRGTENGGTAPFFSPDSQNIGFVAGAGRTLMRVAAVGGPPVTIGTFEQNPWGMEWTSDDLILFGLGDGTGLQAVSSSGGDVRELTTVDAEAGETQHGTPTLLPDGDTVLFSIFYGNPGVGEPQIARLSLSTGHVTPLSVFGSRPRYSPTGHIVYGVSDGTLRAVPFDLDRLEVTDTNPTPVVEDVNTGSFGDSGNFGVADNGTLVYLKGGALTDNRTLTWVDREGQETPIDAPPQPYQMPRLSPDGNRLVVYVADVEEQDLWVLDLSRPGVQYRVTDVPGLDRHPLWSRDGERIVFESFRDGGHTILSKAADGRGEVQELLSLAEPQSIPLMSPGGWTADGRTIVLAYQNPITRFNLGTIDLDTEEPIVEPLLVTDAAENSPVLSPDGQWIAYESDETGQYEVYVERFPSLGDRQPISAGGGRHPVWSQASSEIFYRRLDGTMMVAQYTIADGEFRVTGGQETLFPPGDYYVQASGPRPYAVHPDGQRLLMIKVGSTSGDEPRIVVVQNWTEILQDQVAVD